MSYAKLSEFEKQYCSRKVRESGWEVTPDQFEDELNEVLETIKASLRAMGCDLTTEEVRQMIVRFQAEEERKAKFEKRIADLIASLPREHKPYSVLDGRGGVCKRYADKQDALDDVIERNQRAEKLGVPAVYSFGEAEAGD